MASEWPLAGARRAALVVFAVTILASAASLASGLPGLVKWSLGLITMIAGVGAALRTVRPRIEGLWIDQDRLCVNARRADLRAGRITSAFVSPVFVGVRWRPDGDRWTQTLGIFREQMRVTDFRRLSAALRGRDKA